MVKLMAEVEELRANTGEDEILLTPLHEACRDANLELVQSLLKHGADIHALAGDRQSTPLHLAAECEKDDEKVKEKEEVLALLLEKGADSDLLIGDHEGDTPLHIAAGNFSIFKQMLEKIPHNSVKKILNKKKQSLLHYAAGKGNSDVVKLLVDQGMDKSKDYTGATPFHFAARNGKSVTMTLELLMMDDHVDDANNAGLTALHYAAWNGHNEVVKWLLEKGASVSQVDLALGDTALHWAARNGSSEVIRSLLENDANVCASNKNGDLPIDLAVVFEHSDAATIIWKAMKTAYVFGLMAHRDDGTLLHYAAAYAVEKDVLWVLERIRLTTAKGKDGKGKNFIMNVNKKDRNGENAFHWAASEGNTSVIKALKDGNVDPFAKDAKDRTPLCIALIYKKLKFVSELHKCLGERLTEEEWMDVVGLWTDTFNEEIGLDKQLIQRFRVCMVGTHSDQDIIKREMPPLYKALYVGNQDIAKFILTKSRLFEFVNGKGKITNRTALHWATILKQKRIVSMLCITKEFSEDLLANIADFEGKTPFEYAAEMEIVKELRKRPEVQAYVDGLYTDRQIFVDVSNAILVGASFIASVTYEGWIQGPLNNEYQLFWICNSLSFFFSIATVIAGACAMLPVPEFDIAKAVINICKALTYAAVLLSCSIMFVLFAFAAAGFVTCPPSSCRYRESVLGTIFVGVPICLYFIARFIRQLLKVRPQVSKRMLAQSQDRLSTPPTHLERGRINRDHAGPEYKLGNRHDYIPWDDGLDQLALKQELVDLEL